MPATLLAHYRDPSRIFLRPRSSSHDTVPSHRSHLATVTEGFFCPYPKVEPLYREASLENFYRSGEKLSLIHI